MAANRLLLRETRETVDGPAYHIHPAMVVVFVLLALTLCLLSWALCGALSHLWRIRLRQCFSPAIEEHARPASPLTSIAASSPAPETPRNGDLEKGVLSSEKSLVQPKSINAPPMIIIIGDVTHGAHLTTTSLLGAHTGPKIFSAGLVSDEDFVIPPRRRMSDDGDIIPTPPPSGLFITNPSPADAEDVPEHLEDVPLDTSNSRPSAHQSS